MTAAGCSTTWPWAPRSVASLRPRTLAEFVGQSELKASPRR